MTPLRSRLLAIIGTGLILDLGLQSSRVLRDLGDSDFVAYLTGGRLLGSGGLYSIASQQAAARAIAGHPTNVVYISPPIVADGFAPLARINPHVALVLFVGLSLLALGGAAWAMVAHWLPELTAFQRAVLVVVTVASAPAAYGLALGQLDPILACAVIAGITLSRRFPVIGGVLIGSLVCKPQLLVLVPVALVAGRHWRVLAGVAISAAIAGLSLLAMGIAHLLDWPRFLLAYGNVATTTGRSIAIPEAIARLTGITALDGVVALLFFVGGGVWLWRRRERVSNLPAAVALGLMLTLLASPHLFAYDLVILAVPLVWLGRTRWGLAVSLALLSSAAFAIDSVLGFALLQPVLLLGVSAIMVESRAEPGSGDATMHLPVRSAVAVGVSRA